MSATILEQIAISVRQKLAQRKQKVSIEELQEKVKLARKPRAFVDAFRSPGPHVIAEIKFRSPALGVLETPGAALAVQIAHAYRLGGATAISVLTEEAYFHGHYQYLKEIRAHESGVLLLMKDFVVDEYQILEGLLYGADAVLLIVSLLGKDRTDALMKFAQSVGMSTLVEVHDEVELKDAIALKAPLIGINNRNLKTLEVSLQTSFDLVQHAERAALLISESGIQTAEQMKALSQKGFAGFLIGSALMTSGGPEQTLRSLLAEARREDEISEN